MGVMRFLRYAPFVVLASCGGGGSDYIDMTPPAALDLRENFGGLAIADMDRDGFNDLVVGTNLTEDRQLLETRISIYRQNPTSPGTFLSPVHYERDANGELARMLVIADCQSDGLPDVVTTSWGEGGFRVMLNDPANPGTLVPSVHYDTGPAFSTFAHSHAMGDIDADGFADIVLVDESNVKWIAQDAASLGTFMSPQTIGEGTVDVQMGDINADGLMDVVALGVDGNVSESVLIYYNNSLAPGQFLAPRTFSTPLFADYAGIADYDADGRMDVAVAGAQVDSDDFDRHGTIVVYRQAAPDIFIESAVVRTNGTGISEVFETASLDGDAFPEIVFQVVVDLSGRAVVRIMESTANGEPVIVTDLAIPNEPDNYSTGQDRVVIGDLNNDSLADIAIVRKGVYVFFAQPGGVFGFDDAVKVNPAPQR